MVLKDELARIAAAAEEQAATGETLAAVLVAEPAAGERTYLCAYERAAGRSWLAFDAHGVPISERARIRNAVSIAALCELAEESSGKADAELRVASPAHLDEVARSRNFTPVLRQALGAVEELTKEVEGRYKLPLR